MDIHKPKPWHGVREFLKEYAIIVVGVLTALAAEQAVEWLHVRTEVADAHESLNKEITRNAASLRYAAEEDRCLLTAMDNYVAWAKGGPRPPPVIDAVALPGSATSVWEVLRSGAVAHMPLKARIGYAQFYGAVTNHLTLVAEERAMAGRIGRLVYLDSLSPEEARELLKEANVDRPFLRVKLAQDRGMLQEARDLGAKLKPRGAEAQTKLETLCRMAGAPAPAATDR